MLFNTVKPPSKLINIHAVGISSNGLYELSHLGRGFYFGLRKNTRVKMTETFNVNTNKHKMLYT